MTDLATLTEQVHDKFTRLRLQANHDITALHALVDLIAFLGSGSTNMLPDSIRFLESCEWWPMTQDIYKILNDNVVFDRGQIVWRGENSDGELSD